MAIFKISRGSPKSSKTTKLVPPSQPAIVAAEDAGESFRSTQSQCNPCQAQYQQSPERGYSQSSPTSNTSSISLHSNGDNDSSHVLANDQNMTSDCTEQRIALEGSTQPPAGGHTESSPYSFFSDSASSSVRRPSLVGPAPSESGNDAALPQISRNGRVLPSTLEIHNHDATLPCLAYGTPRPTYSSEDYGSPPAYDTIFELRGTTDAVFRTSTRRGTMA